MRLGKSGGNEPRAFDGRNHGTNPEPPPFSSKLIAREAGGLSAFLGFALCARGVHIHCARTCSRAGISVREIPAFKNESLKSKMNCSAHGVKQTIPHENFDVRGAAAFGSAAVSYRRAL